MFASWRRLRSGFVSTDSLLSSALSFTCALLGLATVAPAQAGEVINRIRAQGEIVMAYEIDATPLSYNDEQGRPQGFAVDLCRELIEGLKGRWNMTQLKVKTLPVDAETRFSAIEKREADMECGGTTNNAERRERFAFSIPHFITGARLVVLSKHPWSRIEELEKRRVVSTKSTTVLEKIHQTNNERSLHLDVLESETDNEGFEMVKSGEAEAFAMDDVLLYGLVATQPHPADFKVIGRFLTIEPLAIMLPKSDLDFKATIDTEMKRLIRAGDVQRLYDKWFMQPIPPRGVVLNIPPNYLLKDFWKYPTDFVPF